MDHSDSGFDRHPILEHDTAARWLGIEVLRANYGDAQVRATVHEDMLNGFGMAHGGAIFMLADTCFAMSCNDPAGDGSTMTVAQNCEIDFLRPAFPGDRLTATSVLRQGARRSSIHDITVTNQDGKAVAEFRGRARTIPTAKTGPAPTPTEEK